MIPTLHELIEEPTNRITFWSTSTDVICPAESPHSHKGTARHLTHSQVWDLVGSHCPRCNDDWGHAKDGLRPCLTRGCYTWKQTGKHTTPPPMSEEDIVFSEFEEDLHEEIANHIDNTYTSVRIGCTTSISAIADSLKARGVAPILHKKGVMDNFDPKAYAKQQLKLVNISANENVDIPSTESKVMSEPREPIFGQGSVTIFGQGSITKQTDIESDVTSQSTGQMEEKI